MPHVIRYDKTTGASFVKTDEGYLVVDGIAVTPGLLRYRNSDGTERIELIDAAEIKASMDSLKLKPVTLLHPSIMVGPGNIKELSVGTVGEVDIRDDSALGVKFTIADEDAIAKADSGMRALSLGYTVRLDMKPGVHPEYGRYDAVQRDRRYNHLAIVPSGRSSGAGFRLDADDNLIPEGKMKHKDAMHGSCCSKMKLCCEKMKLCCDKLCCEMSEEDYKICCKELAMCCIEMRECCKETCMGIGEYELAENMDGNKKEAARLEAEKAEKAEKGKAKKKKDSDEIQEKLDKATSFDVLNAWHVARARLDVLAVKAKIDIKKLDNADASKAILKASGIDADSKSADYVEARIDALAEIKVDPYKGVSRKREDEKPAKKVSYLDGYKSQFKGNE